MDCSPKPNQGCDGGFADDSLTYVVANGLVEEASYPYITRNTTCKYNKINNEKKYKISDFSAIYTDSDAMLNAIIDNGPLIAYISASNRYFQYYGSGIFNYKDCPNNVDDLDHAVTIVGYGTDKTTKLMYWLVKNRFIIYFIICI